MINALHLLWIVPLAGSFGAFAMAIIAGGKEEPAKTPAAEEYERIYIEDEHKYSGLLDDE